MFLSGLAIAAGGFLVAVLWMDLMFDVQVRHSRHQDVVDVAILASIAAYYRRVTTAARPMSYAIGGAMLTGIGSLLVQLLRGDVPSWLSLISLLLIAPPVMLAAARTVPNAIRLGSR